MKKNNTHVFDDIARVMWAMITKATRITLLTHERPDGDGISACTAMDFIARKLGKITETIYPSDPDFCYTRQPASVLINTHTMIPDLIIVFDTATRKRAYFPDVFNGIPLINIDHHISNDIDATIQCIDYNASSACELFYRIISVWGASLIDKDVAAALTMGILFDTQVFQTSSTTAQTLRIVADLMDKGVNLVTIKEELVASKDPKIISLWASFLQAITISPSGKSAWSVIPKKDIIAMGKTLPGLVGFSNFLASISFVDVTVIFYATEDGITKVSLRSRHTDVNELAKKFGGGGHIHAAGITTNMPLEECIAQVTRLLP